MQDKIAVKPVTAVVVPEATVAVVELVPLFQRALESVRDDMRDNPYILEALRVLPVGGYRSAIGSFWNAVVDDLRNKITVRSLSLFNKTLPPGRKDVKVYEDFQNSVNDDELIDGAYKIGVIGWEASKILRHAKETRHIFDGHPRSSEPSPVKVLAMMEDCIKYVLAEPYPPTIIDLDDYFTMLGDQNFDRNGVAVDNALEELPENYKTELANRLFTAYIHPASSSIIRSNIEFVAPRLWRALPKTLKVQVTRRVDQEIAKGNAPVTEQAFAFVRTVDAVRYLSPAARKYLVQPMIEELASSLDNWPTENRLVRELQPYASVIPADLVQPYVSALTHTYVGYVGGSAYYSRTDFFANGAAALIPQMFQAFDDRAAEAFIETVRSSAMLQDRIKYPAKLRRLRSLANIVMEHASETLPDRDFLETLIDESREEEFRKLLAPSGRRKR